MTLRVTDTMLMRASLADVNRRRSILAEIQEQASSGLRVNRPSDDPVAASAAMVLRAGLDATRQFSDNVVQARNRVAVLESALGGANDVLIRARELAIQGSSGTVDTDSRAILAVEIESLFDEMLSNGNMRAGPSFVFAGFDSASTPFLASGPFVDSSPAPSVSFAGDVNEIATEIDEENRVATGFNGQRVFLGDGDGDGSPDPGRTDLFAVLGDLRDALVADDPVAVAAALPQIDLAIGQINLERTVVGGIDAKLSVWEGRLAEREVQLSKGLSDAQDADAAEVFSALVVQETALQAALEAAGRMFQPSLLDFLR